MPIPDHWIELAKKRIKQVLRNRIYLNQRQLESKVSEAGPTNQRCNPHVITRALTELVRDGEVLCDSIPNYCRFFYLPQRRSASSKQFFQQRKQLIDRVYKDYLKLTSGDSKVCGDILELVMTAAISETKSYFPAAISGQKKFGEIEINGPFDGVYFLPGSSHLICVEAKNIREWLYPSSQELWSLIHKSAQFIGSPVSPLPILVTRKIPYYAYDAFKRLGLLGYEMHRQLFAPSVADKLMEIRDKDILGFHDVSTDLRVPPGLTKFFSKTIPEQASTYSAQFAANKPIFDVYAADMANSRTSRERRQQLWAEMKKILGLLHLEE